MQASVGWATVGREWIGLWAEVYGALSVQGRVLVLLAVSIAGLTGLALCFSLYVVWLRFRSILASRRDARLTDLWSEEVLRVLEGGDPRRLLREVEPGDRARFLDFLLAYARLLRGPEREAVNALAAPFLAAVFPNLRHPDPFRRMRAVQVLGYLGMKDHAARVAESLDDDVVLVAMVAARALARQGDPVHVPRILRNLDRFEAWSGPYLSGLLESFGPGAIPALRDFLEDGQHPAAARAVVADALTELKDLLAADSAAAILRGWEERSAENVDLQVALLHLLADLGRPDHAEVSRALLGHPHEAVRAAAVRVLGTLGDDGDLDHVSSAFSDPSPWVALKAARALRAMGQIPALTQLAGSDHGRARLAQQVLQEAR